MKKETLHKPLTMDGGSPENAEDSRLVYVPPKIVTYTSEEIIEQVGPALTCSGAGSPACPIGG